MCPGTVVECDGTCPRVTGRYDIEIKKARPERQLGASRLFFERHTAVQGKKIDPRGVKGDLQRSRKLLYEFDRQEAGARAVGTCAHAYDAHTYAQDGPMAYMSAVHTIPCMHSALYVRYPACTARSYTGVVLVLLRYRGRITPAQQKELLRSSSSE